MMPKNKTTFLQTPTQLMKLGSEPACTVNASWVLALMMLALMFTSINANAVKSETPAAKPHQLTFEQVTEGIKNHYEPRLYQLPPRILGHYGIRMYRMTGDEKYRNAAIADYNAVAVELNRLIAMLDSDKLIAEEAQYLTANLSKGPRGRARTKALKSYPEFIFYGDALLRYAVRVHEFGGEVPTQVIEALKQYDFEAPLTEKTMIKAWAAQLANYAYWLRALGIVDLVDQTQAAFIAAYPDSEDNKLKKWQFKNKVYGMTHFIFAASNYYQQSVDAEKFDWALSYFADNRERIFSQTSADVIAEVGISYLLAQKTNHDIVLEAKEQIRQAYVPEAGMIPSVSGKVALASGEHRNVLAIMLLDWPESLTQGPFIQTD